MRILIIEDDKHISDNIREFLEQNTFSVDNALDGAGWYQQAKSSTPYDCIILDRMLPGMEGAEICKALRNMGMRTPILMLTAKDTIDAKIEWLDSGADDYVVKPFSLRELLSRINALIRRNYDNLSDGMELRVSDLSLDMKNKRVTRGGREIPLSRKHFQLLEFLMRNKGRILSKSEIEEHIWDRNADLWSDVVRSHIQILRSKVDRDFDQKLIRTIHSMGYMITDEP